MVVKPLPTWRINDGVPSRHGRPSRGPWSRAVLGLLECGPEYSRYMHQNRQSVFRRVRRGLSPGTGAVLMAGRGRPRQAARTWSRERRGLDRDLLHLRRVEPVAAARLAVAAGRDEGRRPARGARPRRRVALEDPQVVAGRAVRRRRPRPRPRRATGRSRCTSPGPPRAARPPSPRTGPPRGSRRRTGPRPPRGATAPPAASPLRCQPRRRGRLVEERLDVELDVVEVERDRALVGRHEELGRVLLLRVQHRADRGQRDRQPVAERLGVVVGPEQLEERVAGRRPAAPRDEDLQQVAGLLRLPRGLRDGLAVADEPEPPERLDPQRRSAGRRDRLDDVGRVRGRAAGARPTGRSAPPRRPPRGPPRRRRSGRRRAGSGRRRREPGRGPRSRRPRRPGASASSWSSAVSAASSRLAAMPGSSCRARATSIASVAYRSARSRSPTDSATRAAPSRIVTGATSRPSSIARSARACAWSGSSNTIVWARPIRAGASAWLSLALLAARIAFSNAARARNASPRSGASSPRGSAPGRPTASRSARRSRGRR